MRKRRVSLNGSPLMRWMPVLLGAACGCVLNTEPLGPNSGPEGYLPKFTATEQPNSNMSLTASQVVDKDGKVGVGTTTPNDKLHVAGPGLSVGMGAGDPDAHIYVGESSETGQFGRIVWDSTADELRLSTERGGQTQLVLSNGTGNGGNVGIGTSLPNARLTVKGFGEGFSYNDDSQALHIAQFDIPSTVSMARQGTLSILSTNVSGSGSMAIASYGNDTAGLVFVTGPGNKAQARMVITGTGNVGIGTTKPSDKLEVLDGNVRVSRTGSGTKAGLVIPSAGTFAKPVCDAMIQGAITYELTGETGHFYGCRRIAGGTFEWARLDPP